MSALGTVSATVLVLAYTWALSGWALSLLWSWFIVTAFALPALSIPQALGLSLVVGYMTMQIREDDKKREWADVLLRGLVHGTAKPLTALAFGLALKVLL